MRYILLSFLMLTTASISFAAETTTDCPMMREQNDRTNPKANLAAVKSSKPRQVKSASAQ